MSWERRRNGRSYYYQATKARGRVVKQYVGAGPLVAALVALDAEERAERARHAAAAAAERARLLAADRPLEAYSAQVDALVRATLLLAGYRQHHRGEWRRRRGDQAR